MTSQLFLKSVKLLHNIEQTADVCVQNYHKLIKINKLLVDAQVKMFNRIKLIQKATQKVIKKIAPNQIFQKLQSIKNDPIFSTTKIRPKTRENVHRRIYRQLQIRDNRSKKNLFQPLKTYHQNNMLEDIQSPKKVLVQRINQQRIKNARLIKEDRQRNKIIIELHKKKELTRKLQSANMIRREREKAKEIKEQVMREKHEDFKKQIQQKYEREKKQYIKLQLHLKQLQEKEKQALISWIKTIQS